MEGTATLEAGEVQEAAEEGVRWVKNREADEGGWSTLSASQLSLP